MGKFVDLTGNVYGALTVIKRAGTKNGHVTWECRCECGNMTVTNSSLLKSGTTKSCGCRRVYKCGETHRKHGQTRTRLYIIWQHMKQRCLNPKAAKYKYYGGRGITVCEEWLSYESFSKWAIENGYQEDLTLDRIDVNGNYEPSNCRWATWKVQQNNKRNNNIITAFNESHTLSEWQEITGVNRVTIRKRINKGIAPEIAMR